MIKNRYDIQGDHTIIYLVRKGETHRTLVDTDVFEELIKPKKCTWFAQKSNITGSYYVTSKETYPSGKRVVNSLHRMIMGFPDGMVVDHINHNTLDNRKCNLRVVTYSTNSLNLKPRKDKEIGVYWVKRDKRWKVMIKKHGHPFYGGQFERYEDAVRKSRELREKVINI